MRPANMCSACSMPLRTFSPTAVAPPTLLKMAVRNVSSSGCCIASISGSDRCAKVSARGSNAACVYWHGVSYTCSYNSQWLARTGWSMPFSIRRFITMGLTLLSLVW